MPKKVGSDFDGVTVYKVVRVKNLVIMDGVIKSGTMYSPYYQESRILPQNNGVTTKEDVLIGDLTKLPVTQKAKDYTYTLPHKVAIIDLMERKSDNYDTHITPQLYDKTRTPIYLNNIRYELGMYSYTKGFVFSYTDLEMAKRSVENLKNRKLLSNVNLSEKNRFGPYLAENDLVQPQEYQYAIMNCTVPEKYGLNEANKTQNGYTYKKNAATNYYVKTFEKTSSLATKALIINSINTIYDPFMYPENYTPFD